MCRGGGGKFNNFIISNRSVDLDRHELISYNRNLYSQLSVKTIQLIVIITIYKSGVCRLLDGDIVQRSKKNPTTFGSNNNYSLEMLSKRDQTHGPEVVGEIAVG